MYMHKYYEEKCCFIALLGLGSHTFYYYLNIANRANWRFDLFSIGESVVLFMYYLGSKVLRWKRQLSTYLVVMGRSSVRSLKTARTDPILAGPDRPKTDPKRPKDRGLFSVFFLGENTTNFSQFSLNVTMLMIVNDC